ncbi:cysteine--tRNA ligase, chloroplastic/mitochondrial isoform X3, partial [Tanacetum coccineum]
MADSSNPPNNQKLISIKLKLSWLQILQDYEEAVCQQNEPSLNDNIPTEIDDMIEDFNDVFIYAMSEDLHSLVVLFSISDPFKAANDLLHTHK